MHATAPPPLSDRKRSALRAAESVRSQDRRPNALLGAAVAILAWLALGALTGLGKVEQLLLPLIPIVAALGALLAISRLRLALWVGAGIVIVALALVAMTPLVTTLLPTKQLVRRDNIPPHLDAVIVLSEGITPDSLLGPESVDRLLAGLTLMRDSVAPVLVVTRPHRRDDPITAEPDQVRLRSLVMRPFDMVAIDSVRTTLDEATNAWRALRPRGITSVAVVTSPLHSRRACATFEQAGFTVTCVPSASRSYSVRRPDSATSRLALFRAWLYETLASLEYRTRGWARA
jgi:uncharacterized SAM-binding protein YcdF (DUF218 family)